MEITFETKNLIVGYGKRSIVENVDFSVKSGEVLTLIGPNGSGKSTILKTISKQIQALNGISVLEDKDIWEIKDAEFAKRLSIVTTQGIHVSLMSCEEIVAMGRYPYTGRFGVLSDEDHRIIDMSLKLVDMEDYASKDFNTLSDGQKQRILLAKAICQEPDVLILDEPTSYLDLGYKLDLMLQIKRLAKDKNMLIIMSLHEIDLAQKISDYVMCINHARVEQYGTPEVIFKEDYIEELYQLPKGCYQELYGNIELPGIMDEPKVFVIGGAGTGIPVYRMLRRQNIPFSVGILHENDMDYPVAKMLAANVISAPAYENMTEDMVDRAKCEIDKVEKVIKRYISHYRKVQENE